MLSMRLVWCVVFGVAAAFGSAAIAADVQVAATVAARSALTALAFDFEKQTGHRVVLRFGTTNAVRDELLAGRPFDAAVLTTRAVDELSEKRLVAPPTKVGLFRSGVGISSPAASTIAIRTSKELHMALLAADRIALSLQGSTGLIMRGVFERLGVASEMPSKLIPLSGQTSTEAVADGKAQLGFTQVSEILEVPAARLVGPLPPDLQVYSEYAGAVAAKSVVPEAAKAFVLLLRSNEGRWKLQALGLEPID